MRLFVNLLYGFKKSDKISEILTRFEQTMAENQWGQEQIFFHFHDINEAASETRTPHYVLMKAFPQMKPYWRSAFNEYCVTHPYDETLPKEHCFSYISNFPGRQSGQPIYPSDDSDINIELIKEMFAKIPKPCSFYSSLVMFDGINWSGNSDLSTALDWIAMNNQPGHEDIDAGYWPNGMSFDEICPFYQSNSVRIGKDWQLEPEMTVQVEVFPYQGLDVVKKVEKAFETQFGKPVKRYTRAVYPWEERESYHDRTKRMEDFFTRWSEKIRKYSLQRQEEVKEHSSNSIKSVSRNSLKKSFYRNNGLEHYPLSRWDDTRCFCKVLEHNYHLEVGLVMNQNPPQDGQVHIDPNEMYVMCTGCNFELSDRWVVEDFVSQEKDIAGMLAFELWQKYLDQFEEEVVPELFAIFGETPKEMIYDSRKFTGRNEETIGMKDRRF